MPWRRKPRRARWHARWAHLFTKRPEWRSTHCLAENATLKLLIRQNKALRGRREEHMEGEREEARRKEREAHRSAAEM